MTDKGCVGMTGASQVIILCVIAMAHLPAAGLQSSDFVGSKPETDRVISSTNQKDTLRVPSGKSTITGGDIITIDPVQDEITLKVAGQRQEKIFFDERTRVYWDGQESQLRSLVPGVHASVQTVLDGTSIFALSIHLFSRAPEGLFDGRVAHFNATTRQLTLTLLTSSNSIRLFVPPSTPILRTGQNVVVAGSSGVSDLVPGALISVTFGRNKESGSTAAKIAILASPGVAFVFSGSLSSLNMRARSLVMIDPQDQKSYRIFFKRSQLPSDQSMRYGEHIRATATYDGTRYVASVLVFN